jgi:predicted SPOUT superfamily RNA methylase MTH1
MKQKLLQKYWGETMDENGGQTAKEAADGIRIRIGAALLAKMDEDRILEEEARDVVAFCERTGRRIYNAEKQTYSGYRKIGHMSYWAEYRKLPDGQGIELVSAYTHRMEIELEAVWNGVKTNIDL